MEPISHPGAGPRARNESARPRLVLVYQAARALVQISSGDTKMDGRSPPSPRSRTAFFILAIGRRQSGAVSVRNANSTAL